MADETNPDEKPDTETPGTDDKTINDPLTRDEVEAPRTAFEGRTPKDE